MFLLSLWYGILFLIPSEFQTYLRKENNTMNKVKYLPLIILCMLLTGCGNKNNISKEVSTETAVHTSEVELKTAVETESESTSGSDGKARRPVQINGGRKVTRREAREHCFKMLFCQDFYPAEEKEEQLERYFEAPKEDVTGEDGKDEILHDPFEKEEDRAYLEKRVEKIMELIPEIDEKINEIAEGWRTRRMGKVELTILRLAVFEMKYDEEIPEKVAINEAVELAKKFGGDEAPAFVNGILAKLIQKGN